jgi:hypothetical protein
MDFVTRTKMIISTLLLVIGMVVIAVKIHALLVHFHAPLIFYVLIQIQGITPTHSRKYSMKIVLHVTLVSIPTQAENLNVYPVKWDTMEPKME